LTRERLSLASAFWGVNQKTLLTSIVQNDSYFCSDPYSALSALLPHYLISVHFIKLLISASLELFKQIIFIIISCHRFSVYRGTSPLEPVVNPTTQASSLSLEHFPYEV
jgi:hypothetical protein